jgi:hypothetical protein
MGKALVPVDLKCSVLILQADDDRYVPSQQPSESIEALRSHHVEHKVLGLPNEIHDFAPHASRKVQLRTENGNKQPNKRKSVDNSLFRAIISQTRHQEPPSPLIILPPLNRRALGFSRSILTGTRRSGISVTQNIFVPRCVRSSKRASVSTGIVLVFHMINFGLNV